MILIISHKEDYTTDFLVNILNKRNLPYFRLNTDDIGIRHKITYSSDSNNSISLDGYTNFNSVWFRRTKPPNLEFSRHNEQAFFIKDFRSFLKNLWLSLDIKNWVSYPEHIYKAENKLYQLQIAQSLNFKIPKTIISTDKVEIKNFYKNNNGRLIIKPLSGGRFIENGKPKLIFTNKVIEDHILENSGFVSFPMIFQEEILKEYELRVTVVGDQVFSAKVDSQSNINTKTDWRKDRIKFYKYNLPNEISEKCIELVSALNLKFGAIDLIKTKSSYVFLEINPNGQWVWVENDTGLKISDAIIKYLTE